MLAFTSSAAADALPGSGSERAADAKAAASLRAAPEPVAAQVPLTSEPAPSAQPPASAVERGNDRFFMLMLLGRAAGSPGQFGRLGQ